MLLVTLVFSRRVYVQPRINSFETAFRKFHAAKPAKLANINGRKTISKPITEKAVTFSGILTLGSFIAWTLCSEEAVACCDAGPIDPIISKVKDFAEATIAPWVQEHGLSGTLGFCSGVAIKRLGRSIVVAIGGMILIAQVLNCNSRLLLSTRYANDSQLGTAILWLCKH